MIAGKYNSVYANEYSKSPHQQCRPEAGATNHPYRLCDTSGKNNQAQAYRYFQRTCIDRERACTVRECKFASCSERTNCRTVEAWKPGGRVWSSLLSKIAPASVLRGRIKDVQWYWAQERTYQPYGGTRKTHQKKSTGTRRSLLTP